MAKNNKLNLGSIVSAADIQKKRANLGADLEEIAKSQNQEVTGNLSIETNKNSNNKIEEQTSSKPTKYSKKTETVLSIAENNSINEPRISNPIGESFDKKIEAIRSAIAKTTNKKVYKKQILENIMTHFFDNHIEEIKELIENARKQENAF